MWRKRNTCALWMGMQIGAAAVESSMRILQKIKKMDLPYAPRSILGIYPKKPGTLIQKVICTQLHIVHRSVIYNCQDMEAAQVPISR